MPHVNKVLARKQIFVQTPLSHSTFKLDQNMHAAKPLAFSLPISESPKASLQFDFKIM